VAVGNNEKSGEASESHSNVESGSKQESGNASKPPSRSARVYKTVNRPLFVTIVGGIVVFAVSVQVQHRYWQKENEYLVARARIDRTWEAVQKAQEEMVKALGKRLAVTATLIADHENQVKLKQHVDDVKRYDNALEEWDEASEVIRFQMTSLFANSSIQEKWEALQNDLHDLHLDIGDLEKYSPSKPSPAQDAQAEKCKEHVTRIEEKIDDLNKTMTAYASKGGNAQP
jgi:hypothetical protein